MCEVVSYELQLSYNLGLYKFIVNCLPPVPVLSAILLLAGYSSVTLGQKYRLYRFKNNISESCNDTLE